MSGNGTFRVRKIKKNTLKMFLTLLEMKLSSPKFKNELARPEN